MTRTVEIGIAAALLFMVHDSQPFALASASPRQTPAPAQVPLLTPEEQRIVDIQVAARRLDGTVRIPSLKLDATPVRSVLDAIARSTDLIVRFDQNVPELDRPCTVNLTLASLDDALKAVLGPNGLVFIVTGRKSIFVYSDTPANRRKYAESIRTFALAKADPTQVMAILNDSISQMPDTIRPTIVALRTSRTITVRATSERMAEIERMIAAIDKD